MQATPSSHASAEPTILMLGVLILGISLLLQMIPFIRKMMANVVVLIFTGVLLGPSVLGHFFPGAYAYLFPPDILKGMVWVNTLAVSLFGLMVGLHFNMKHLSTRNGFPVTSTMTVLLPMIICGFGAWWLGYAHPSLIGSGVQPMTFVLAMAICGSVTALPVLAAILLHMGMAPTKIGQRAVAYATVNDLFLWILIAVVFAFNGSTDGFGKVWWTLGMSAVFMIIMFMIVKPFIRYALSHHWFINGSNPRNRQLAFVLAMAWLAGWVTDWIGIHYLLGCFLVGAIVPKHVRVASRSEPINFAHGFEKKIRLIILEALVPFFFVSTGLRTDLQLGNISTALVICFVVMTVATTIGKFFGTLLPVMQFGGTFREGAILGVFMNTKGMMEVIVLNIMLSSGIISTVTFSAMIMMTLVTTAMTMPLAQWFINSDPSLLAHDTDSFEVTQEAQAVSA